MANQILYDFNDEVNDTTMYTHSSRLLAKGHGLVQFTESGNNISETYTLKEFLREGSVLK